LYSLPLADFARPMEVIQQIRRLSTVSDIQQRYNADGMHLLEIGTAMHRTRQSNATAGA
jgi:hypothetical protein